MKRPGFFNGVLVALVLALIAGAHGGSLATFDSRAAALAQDLGAQAVLLEA